MRRVAARFVLVTMVAWSVAASACRSSHSETGTGTGGVTPPRGAAADLFAYSKPQNSAWGLVFGQFAAYLIAMFREPPPSITGPLAARGALAPRLLSDTVVIADSIGGPPPGTDLDTPGYLTFDATKNVWITLTGPSGDGAVAGYTRAEQSSGGTPQPVSLVRGLSQPNGIAFDNAGALWVVDGGTDQLEEFTSSQIALNSSVPALTMSLAGLTVDGHTWIPFSLVIDAQGNAWVGAKIDSNPAVPGSDTIPTWVVAEFKPESTVPGAAPAPLLTLVTSGSHAGGYGPALAFDANGNLWTGNAATGTITEFAAGSLTDSARPTPVVTITSRFQGMADLAFDSDGVLYAGGSITGAGGVIAAFPPRVLTASGSPSPKVTFAPSSSVGHFAVK